ncbi:hypothetical protein PsYK624_119950 [Phanerochaete sordida]|uniref:Uncharacterized protein n=1 Tax=Phanerochaete sordida TaxID=48140 RepID=A0A9P3GIM9_9APHY|nr:hypothetical protein PsYK624_119950 [Phanerochaete sordida]
MSGRGCRDWQAKNMVFARSRGGHVLFEQLGLLLTQDSIHKDRIYGVDDREIMAMQLRRVKRILG